MLIFILSGIHTYSEIAVAWGSSVARLESEGLKSFRGDGC